MLADRGQQRAPLHLLSLDCPAHSVTCFIEGLQPKNGLCEDRGPENSMHPAMGGAHHQEGIALCGDLISIMSREPAAYDLQQPQILSQGMHTC